MARRSNRRRAISLLSINRQRTLFKDNLIEAGDYAGVGSETAAHMQHDAVAQVGIVVIEGIVFSKAVSFEQTFRTDFQHYEIVMLCSF